MQQQGIPRTDVAIYNKVSVSDAEFATVYQFDESEPIGQKRARVLTIKGWKYQYLTADNLQIPQARVEESVLAPDGPQYKAMVLPETSNLT